MKNEKNELERMSDSELAEFAEQVGCEEMIVFNKIDGHNEIVNRAEVIKCIIDMHNNENTWDDEDGTDLITFE